MYAWSSRCEDSLRHENLVLERSEVWKDGEKIGDMYQIWGFDAEN